MTQQQSCCEFSGVSLPYDVGPPAPRPPPKPPPSPPPPPPPAYSSSTRLTRDDPGLWKCRLSAECCLPKWILIGERFAVRVLGRVDATGAVRLQRAAVAANQSIELFVWTRLVLAVRLELSESRQLHTVIKPIHNWCLHLSSFSSQDVALN